MTPWQIRQAARALDGGGVIAYPTETVYGLGCKPLERSAVERLLALKTRPVEKGLILVAAELAQLRPYLDISDPRLLAKLQQSTPHPTTWIAPCCRTTPHWLRGQHDSLAVRLCRHPGVQALCRRVGDAIVSTSANPQGLEPARSAMKVRRYFGNEIDYLLAGPVPANARPSEIRELVSGRVVRPG